MDRVAYTVIITFSEPELVPQYVSWLSGGHIRQVCEAGALSGLVVLLDPALDELPTLEVRYLFPSRAALERYLTDHAPRLRAEGLARFGPASGVTYRRTTGTVTHVETNQ